MKILRSWRICTFASFLLTLLLAAPAGAAPARATSVPSVVSETPAEACARQHVQSDQSWNGILKCFNGNVDVARSWLQQICVNFPEISTLCNVKIVGKLTHREGPLVWLSVYYIDLAKQASGFAFHGIKGSGWAPEEHSFNSPSYGRVHLTAIGGSIDYPFNQQCGTNREYASDVQFLIIDAYGLIGDSTDAHLKC